jgi:small subunit ribosomal protein S24e
MNRLPPPPADEKTHRARGIAKEMGRCKLMIYCYSDVLHPNRPNVSKDELRQKLSELYKSDKDQVSVFGFRTQYGGGKSTGFALVYDSAEAMKKFEPHYRLVRYGQASKIEKPSRQQRTLNIMGEEHWIPHGWNRGQYTDKLHRQAAQEQGQGVPWCCEEDRWRRQEEEISDSIPWRYYFLTRLCAAFLHGSHACIIGGKSDVATKSKPKQLSTNSDLSSA